MGTKPTILISGAGIGGLVAALALIERGFDVRVFEQAAALREVGAGFQVSANGTRVLYGLGLGPAIDRIAWEPQGKEIRLWNTGETWKLFDLAQESVARYGFPYLMFHRADLHAALVEAIRAKRPEAVETGRKVIGFTQDDSGVTIRFEGGGEARGDMLIGADGVHSTIRQALFGADRPSFTGMVAWRGLIPAERLPAHLLKPVGTNWVGPGGHVVHYFVRGGALLNFVGILERDDWRVESWTTRGTTEDFLRDFSGWHPDIQTMIRAIDEPYVWALMVREPLPSWADGRVGLLGDACHSTLPNLAQGAVMAIEDGYVLARAVEAHPEDPRRALRAYEAARHARTTRVVLGSADMAKRFHSSTLGDAEQAARYVDREWQPELVRQRYDWLFTYDAAAAAV
jgi:salicylate hydroxylase